MHSSAGGTDPGRATWSNWQAATVAFCWGLSGSAGTRPGVNTWSNVRIYSTVYMAAFLAIEQAAHVAFC